MADYAEVLMKSASVVFDSKGNPLDLTQCTQSTVPTTVGNVTTYVTTATKADIYGGGVWTKTDTITVVNGVLTGTTEGMWIAP